MAQHTVEVNHRGRVGCGCRVLLCDAGMLICRFMLAAWGQQRQCDRHSQNVPGKCRPMVRVRRDSSISHGHEIPRANAPIKGNIA